MYRSSDTSGCGRCTYCDTFTTMTSSALCSVCYLVLLAMAPAVNAQSPPSSTSGEEMTPARGPEAATGEEGAGALGDASHQVAQGLLRPQEALGLQEQRTAPALRQEGDEVNRALCHSLEERMQRLEERLGEPMLQPNPRSNDHGDAAAEGQLSMHQLVSRVEKLEATVQRVLERMPIEDPVEQQTEQPSKSNASSPVLIFSTSPLIFTSIRRQLPADSALEATTTEAAPTEEELRQRVTLTMLETKKKVDRAYADPYSLGEALCQAAYEGRLEDVRRLLDSGTNVNYINKSGQSPLISSFYLHNERHCHPDVVSLLLERGADVNLIDMDGRFALHHAAIVPSSVKCMELLIAAGADIDARNDFGATPLMEAAMFQNEASVRALLAAGARKNVKGWKWPWLDMTAFDFAATDELRDLLRE